MSSPKNVMVDLETLAVTADAVVVSIGAVKFTHKKIEDSAFYTPVSVNSNLSLGRRVDENTLSWWMSQPETARKVFSQPAISIEEALEQFSDWLKGEDVLMWANGADFDLAILQHAYCQLGVTVPWKFWNNRCFRTVKNTVPFKVPPVDVGVKHNALDDALAQARQLQHIWKALDEKARA